MAHETGCRFYNTGCDGDCDCGAEQCPQCHRADEVEEADKTGLTSDQAGCRWSCMRCNLVFGHPDEPAPLPSEFARGAQACREMMACFVENGGDPITAASIRANWNPSWGRDPGRPITLPEPRK